MNDKKPLGFWQILGSVFASFFGVQSNAKRERDFSQGRARDFVMVGVILTALFILIVYGVVKLVTSIAIDLSLIHI